MNSNHELSPRDHRDIGRDLDLFAFSDLVGSGLPLWTPKGHNNKTRAGTIRMGIARKIRLRARNPPYHQTRFIRDLGTLGKIRRRPVPHYSRDGREYALKPMNCPHHTQIFARHPHSYHEMPQRYAETTMVYRDEQSGELGGLTRVLSITQDDSHVFSRMSQIKEEFMHTWNIVDTFYKTFWIRSPRPAFFP